MATILVKDPSGKLVSCFAIPDPKEAEDLFLTTVNSRGRDLDDYDWSEISETNCFEDEKGTVQFIK